MTRSITRVETRLVRAPLPRPWGPDVLTNTFVAVDVRTEAGDVGHGFTWTPPRGGARAAVVIAPALAPRAGGRRADTALGDGRGAAVSEAGGGGVTSIALAGIDLALWDLRGRLEGRSVIDLLGRRHDSQPAYGSGINRHYPIDDLLAQVERFVARGHDAVKVKVGGRPLAEDLERVAAVRAVIGPGRRLMVDANQLWDLDGAVAAAHGLARFDIAWLEEPLRADDTPGYAALRRRSSLPIALGENAHTWYRFRDLLDAGACDIAEPNIVRVGGITPFLRILELCRDRGVAAYPHLLPDLSAQLAMTLPETTLIEDVEDASLQALGVLAAPTGVRIADGRVTATGRPGLGIELL